MVERAPLWTVTLADISFAFSLSRPLPFASHAGAELVSCFHDGCRICASHAVLLRLFRLLIVFRTRRPVLFLNFSFFQIKINKQKIIHRVMDDRLNGRGAFIHSSHNDALMGAFLCRAEIIDVMNRALQNGGQREGRSSISRHSRHGEPDVRGLGVRLPAARPRSHNVRPSGAELPRQNPDT